MDRKRRIHPGRELTGAVLLVGLLVLGLLTSWHMVRTHNAISRELEDAAWHALSNTWNKAEDSAFSARQQWQEHWKLSAAFADHSAMEEIDAGFSRLSMYAAARDSGEFAAVCAELSRYVQAMGDAHSLTWWNLL